VRYHQRYQIVQNRSLAYEIVARRSGGAPRTPDTGIPISPSPETRQDDRRAAPLWELVQRHFRQGDGLGRWPGFVRWRRFNLVVGVGLWVDNDSNRIADLFSQVGRSNSTSGTMAARGATVAYSTTTMPHRVRAPPIYTLGYATALSKGNRSFALRGDRSNRAARTTEANAGRILETQVTKFEE
jgi:hypothetical protein